LTVSVVLVLLLCAVVALLIHPMRSSHVLRASALVGFGAALLWSLCFLGWRWHQVRGRRGVVRGVLGWTTVALIFVWMVLFAVSFRRRRAPHLDNVYGVSALAFAAGALLTYLIVIAPALLRGVRQERAGQVPDGSEEEPSADSVHQASVCYMYDRAGSWPGFYAAVCSCGWSSDLFDAPDFPDRDAESRAEAAALAHDPSADTRLVFPNDDPNRGRQS